MPENKREARLIKELEEILAREGLSSHPSEKGEYYYHISILFFFGSCYCNRTSAHPALLNFWPRTSFKSIISMKIEGALSRIFILSKLYSCIHILREAKKILACISVFQFPCDCNYIAAENVVTILAKRHFGRKIGHH